MSKAKMNVIKKWWRKRQYKIYGVNSIGEWFRYMDAVA